MNLYACQSEPTLGFRAKLLENFFMNLNGARLAPAMRSRLDTQTLSAGDPLPRWLPGTPLSYKCQSLAFRGDSLYPALVSFSFYSPLQCQPANQRIWGKGEFHANL